MTLTSTGCASLDARREIAAREQGRIEAGIILPALPEECRRHEEHAPLIVGAETIIALKKERQALDRANNRIDLCAYHYDSLLKNLAETE